MLVILFNISYSCSLSPLLFLCKMHMWKQKCLNMLCVLNVTVVLLLGYMVILTKYMLEYHHSIIVDILIINILIKQLAHIAMTPDLSPQLRFPPSLIFALQEGRIDLQPLSRLSPNFVKMGL